MKKRIRWSVVLECISDTHFRRIFCMTRECFILLCGKIIASIGESNFKSEAYIDAFLTKEGIVHDCVSIMTRAHMLSSGGFISGEVKLAITIKLVAGGSTLDLAVLFDALESHVKSILVKVLKS